MDNADKTFSNERNPELRNSNKMSACKHKLKCD